MDRQLCRPPQPPQLCPLPHLHVLYLLLLRPRLLAGFLLGHQHGSHRQHHLASALFEIDHGFLVDPRCDYRDRDRWVDVVAGVFGEDRVDDDRLLSMEGFSRCWKGTWD